MRTQKLQRRDSSLITRFGGQGSWRVWGTKDRRQRVSIFSALVFGRPSFLDLELIGMGAEERGWGPRNREAGDRFPIPGPWRMGEGKLGEGSEDDGGGSLELTGILCLEEQGKDRLGRRRDEKGLKTRTDIGLHPTGVCRQKSSPLPSGLFAGLGVP